MIQDRFVSALSSPSMVEAETGRSPEARSIEKMLEEWVKYQALASRSLVEALELQQAIQRASTANWDGYGALPVTAGVARAAWRFHRLLPMRVPPADIGTDPDGEISFEWYVAPDNILSVSIGEGGRISFAGIHGSKKLNGTERIRAALSEELLAQLRRFHLDPLTADHEPAH